jgi:hypothetical protein
MVNRKIAILFAVVVFVMGGMVTFSHGEQFLINGKPLDAVAYLTQGLQFKLEEKDVYDNESGLNGALSSLFLEGTYQASDNLKMYASGMVNIDWIYDLKSDDTSWNQKEFNKSRDNLYIDDHSWQFLKEAHFTYTPGNWLFRVGKQIVSWGNTSGVRIADQINPSDQRRGFMDLEWETSIIPIYLIRAEYHPEFSTTWLRDVGFQFVFNPNAQFIPDQVGQLGNDEGGIWSPNIVINTPIGPARVGSGPTIADEPKEWDPEGFEYGFRTTAIIGGTQLKMGYFYGIANSPVTLADHSAPPRITIASDGLPVIHAAMNGFYPLDRFVNFAYFRDLSFLGKFGKALALDHSAGEALYRFNNTYSGEETFEHSDELRWAAMVAQKFSLPFLNKHDFIFAANQLSNTKVFARDIHADNYSYLFTVGTKYFNGQLEPAFVWIHTLGGDGGTIVRYQVRYYPTVKWTFTLSAMTFSGGVMRIFDNKNLITLKAQYKFG